MCIPLEKKSDGSEYKKTLRRPPDPAEGAYSAPANHAPIWWGGVGCPLPKNPIPRSRPFGPRLSYPHSKISSDPVELSYCVLRSKMLLCVGDN